MSKPQTPGEYLRAISHNPYYANEDKSFRHADTCDALLAACKALIARVDIDHEEPVELPRCRFDDIRAAIAKAEGGGE